MPLRLPPLLLLAALLAACGGPRGAGPDAEAGLRDGLLNLQASLAALGGPAPDQPEATPGPIAEAPAPAAAPPAAAPVVAALPVSAAAIPSLPMILPPPRPEAAGLPPRTAAQLLGQPPELVRHWLGEPLLRRPEGAGAEIWLYAAASCALDLVLYRERGGRLRVAFAAARAAGEGAATGTEAECLRRIADGPGTRPST